MKLTNVSQIPLPGVMLNTPAKSAAKSEGDQTDFMQIMGGSLSNADSMNLNSEISAPANNYPKVVENETQTGYRFENPAREIPQAETTSNTASPEEVAKAGEEFNKFIEKTIATISKEMDDVSEEDIVKAMDNLGLEWVDLTIPENVTMLLSELSGEEGSIELLVSDTIANVTNAVEGLANELFAATGLNDDSELKAVLFEGGIIPDEETEETSVTLGPLGEVTEAEDPLNEDVSTPFFKPVQTDSETENITKVPMQEVTKTETVVTAEAIDPKTVTKQEAPLVEVKTEEIGKDGQEKENFIITDAKEDRPSDNQSKDFGSGSFNEQQRQPMQPKDTESVLPHHTEQSAVSTPIVQANTGVSFGDMVSETQFSYTDVNPRAIMEQIVTQTRTLVTETFSSMELELHPASLGKMYLQVSESDGHITARLFTENENVKNAMESQMVALKETWEAQGIRVNAVEITVGTKEFEERLDQEAQNDVFQNEAGSANQSFNEDETPRGNRMRSIDLNHLDEMPEDLTDEELLTASMMRDYGNSVNYMA